MGEPQRADIEVKQDMTDMGLYSIVSSYTIRPKSKFKVAVSILKANGPCVTEITLKGPSYEDTKIVEANPMTTEQVEFDVPAINDGDYYLIGKGLQGITFTKSFPLSFQDYKPIVLIQLDKAAYKPGDLVQFRVIFMDENTRPTSTENPIYITISDSQKNRLKQWKDVELKKGVFTGEYQLSEQPILGDWRIDVTVDGETLESKFFEVDKYVIPKFNVSLDAIKDVAMYDGIVNVTVRSQYTYGKGVKGKATITIKPKYDYSSDSSCNSKAVKTVDVNGKGQVQFKIGQDFKVERDTDINMEILAVMEEDLTGNKMETSTSVILHSQRFFFEAIDNLFDFHPEIPLTIKVAVKTFDYLPVVNSKHPIKLIIEKTRHYFGGTEMEKIPQEENVLAELISNLDENGIATFEYTFPESEKKYYYLKCEYLECESHLKTVSKYEKPDSVPEDLLDSLSVNVLTKNPTLIDIVEVEVKSEDAIPYFAYTLNARGKHLKTELVTLAEGTKGAIVKIKPTFEMVPYASIFVHYVVGNDLKYEETTISFEREFENFLDIKAPTETNPGDEVALDIKSNPDSYVGILGVDQSVLLHKSGNDLSADNIFDCLQSFDNSTEFRKREARCPGENSGLAILTNAVYPIYDSSRMILMCSGGPMYDAQPECCEDTELVYDDEEESRPVLRTRKEFPETFLFEDIENFDSNSYVIRKNIPDTITSWVITGFSINPTKGIALLKNPSLIKTFRPFFISTNLPYSVKRGEQISISVIAFNYMENDVKADITLENDDDEYDFVEPGLDSTKRTKSVAIPSNTGENACFLIRPKRIGRTILKISAVSPIAGDALRKELIVEPEGICVYKNRDYYIHLEDGIADVQNTVQLDIPENVVPDSECIEISAMGNILGSTITNIDNLVRLPCGCGEQVMVNFVPNVLILWYLESIQELTDTIREKARRFLEMGYQSELTYKHKDGSYSAFGKSDPSGSTWLTAYVMRCFHQATKYIDVDSKILQEGLTFLAKIQAPNGCFPEVGHVFDSSHMNDLGLTAFVLLAFLENSELMVQYKATIDRGFDFLLQNWRHTNDLYALSVAVYALQQRKLDVVHEILAKLETLARFDGGLKYWAMKPKNEADVKPFWYEPSHDVEITGYILMTLLGVNMPVLPIVRYLISQRNSNGGYGSTQDTVVGLWALIKFAEKNGSTIPKMDIEVNTPVQAGSVKHFSIDKTNSMLTQVFELPKDTREITFTGKGSGTSILQISCRYNTLDGVKTPYFKLSTEIKPKVAPSLMSMDILTEFLPQDGQAHNTSNMVVMEVPLPSGYTAITESFDNIREVDGVKRVESDNDNTKIIIYFENLKISDQKRIPIEAELSYPVTGQKPVPIVIYDYYDNEKRATEFYQIENTLMEE